LLFSDLLKCGLAVCQNMLGRNANNSSASKMLLSCSCLLPAFCGLLLAAAVCWLLVAADVHATQR